MPSSVVIAPCTIGIPTACDEHGIFPFIFVFRGKNPSTYYLDCPNDKLGVVKMGKL
jgi:hypothetical protein